MSQIAPAITGPLFQPASTTPGLSPGAEVTPKLAAAPSTTPAVIAAVDHRHHRDRPLTWRDLDPVNFLGIGSMHVLAIAAPFTFSWSGMGIAIALWWLCGGLGICLCYHRLLTHRSFKTPRWFEYVLTTLGVLNWQGGPVQWVGMHRIHHKHSDGEHDPHSPKHGFNWAHILWCVTREPEGMDARGAAKDLQRNPVTAWFDKYHFLPQFVLAGALFGAGWAFGGLPLALSWLVWGVAVRVVFVYHATWFVNSAAHTWGYQSHDTGDGSKNNWWVAILSFGEGWHNNHHACDRAAAHGRKWYEVDLTYYTIKALSWVGLAWDIVPPKGT